MEKIEDAQFRALSRAHDQRTGSPALRVSRRGSRGPASDHQNAQRILREIVQSMEKRRILRLCVVARLN